MMPGTTDDPAIAALRERVLLAALPHVPFDGWTPRALMAGARDLGQPESDAQRAFPGGPVEAIGFFTAWADRRMVEAFEAAEPAALRTRERVAAAVRLRLEQNAPHREAIRRALTVLAQPQHAGLAATSLYRTVDAVWYACGDRSTDFNFYTKRALLAGVYGATVLYWLEDRSEGFADTWSFLDRRIADVMRLPQLPGECARRLGALPNPFRILRRARERGRRYGVGGAAR